MRAGEGMRRLPLAPVLQRRSPSSVGFADTFSLLEKGARALGEGAHVFGLAASRPEGLLHSFCPSLARGVRGAERAPQSKTKKVALTRSAPRGFFAFRLVRSSGRGG